MKQFDDVGEFDRRLHADYLKLYAKDKGEYCDVNGRPVIVDLTTVKLTMINYFETRNIADLRRFHFKLSRRRKGIKELIAAGDATKEALLDKMFIEKHKEYARWYPMNCTHKKELDLNIRLARAEVLHNRVGAILKMSPRSICQELERYFETREKNILIALHCLSDAVARIYLDVYLSVSNDLFDDDSKIF